MIGMSDLVYTGFRRFESSLGYALNYYIEFGLKLSVYEQNKIEEHALDAAINSYNLFETTRNKRKLHTRRIKAVHTLHCELGIPPSDLCQILKFGNTEILRWSNEYFIKKPLPKWTKVFDP